MAEGSTPQISRAYSVMVLSLENFPEHAMFLMTFLVHSRGSWGEQRQSQNSAAHPALSWPAALQGTGQFKTPWCQSCLTLPRGTHILQCPSEGLHWSTLIPVTPIFPLSSGCVLP